ncbi:unnamed protein product, partial [marine sediment metagenome]
MPMKGIIQGYTAKKPTIIYDSIPKTPSNVPYVIHAKIEINNANNKRQDKWFDDDLFSL